MPINPNATEIEGVPCHARLVGRSRPRGPRRHRGAQRPRRGRRRRLRGQGCRGDRRDHGGLLRDRRRGPPPRGRAPRQGARRRDADGRPQLHGPRQHGSTVPAERHLRPDLPAGGTGGALLPERGARARPPRLRLEAQSRDLDLRLGRQQGGRLGQRPDPVLGRGPADRRHPPVPRELRQPGPLLEDRPPGRAPEADHRGQVRPLARRVARRDARTPGRSPNPTRSSTRCCGRPASSGRGPSRSSSTSRCSSPTSPFRAAAVSAS